MTVALKRVYAAPSPQDGARVLVDRLWPRGLKKSDAALDAWLKELTTEAANTALQQLYELQKKRRRLTLLFASRNEERNNAVVLKQLVDGERKPPTGTGPIRAAASKRGRAARPR